MILENFSSLPRSNMDYIKLIKDKARASGLTVPELFDRAGIARSQWSRWQRGETAPRLATLEKILEAKPRGKKRP